MNIGSNWRFKCNFCGRFVKIKDIDSKKATRTINIKDANNLSFITKCKKCHEQDSK